ncbi:MAG TPA: hypothetical protein VK796_04825 [Cytophaga sp.]|jgi:hypothetical protein|nr:hypothetical protein [Cytophaga sp.]
MTKYIFIFFLFISLQSIAQQKNNDDSTASKVTLSGVYSGKNIYIQNPWTDDTFKSYCTDSVFVNGTHYIIDLNQSVFEIKLDSLMKVQGKKFTAIIYHKKNCTPKALVSMGFPSSRSKVEFTSFAIDSTGHVHITTRNDSTGNRPPLKIEQFQENTWITVLNIPQKWGVKNSYDTIITLTAGTHTFRLCESMYENTGKIVTVKSASNNKIVQARLIRINGNNNTLLKNDTIFFDEIFVNGNQKIDLKFCLEKFSYPHSLPFDIYWAKPDTAGKSIDEITYIRSKYLFDKTGRVTLYYYKGSTLSGIFPLPYTFEYNSEKPNQIESIKDLYYKITYLIHYNNRNDIHTIEKIDSLNSRIEILIIDMK